VPLKVWTIGHSTRSIEDFVGLLRENRIKLLVDVRSIPFSRMHPQFNQEALRASLADAGVDYLHQIELGGRKGKVKDAPPSQNNAWRVAAFRNYADYALTQPFQLGLAKLIESAKKSRTAIMCSEAVWWKCHRRIITDHLLAHDVEVYHIMAPGKTDLAQLNADAVITPEKQVVYPGEQYQLEM
jgi:uncharacterized protein (DUF488 family)